MKLLQRIKCRLLYTIRHSIFLFKNAKRWKYIMRTKDILYEIIFSRIPNPVILKDKTIIYNNKEDAAFHTLFDIFILEEYTPEFLPIEPNDIVVDIGAQIGIFTLFASQKTKNKIISYEPFPPSFNTLMKNIKENKIKNVKGYCIAVSNSVGKDKLYVRDNTLWCSFFNLSEIFNSHKPTIEKGIEVPTITIEEIFKHNKIEKIDFLKIDCEGKEYDILFSTPKELFTKINKIAVEFHILSKIKYTHYDLQIFLDKLGFNVMIKNYIGENRGYLYGKRK